MTSDYVKSKVCTYFHLFKLRIFIYLNNVTFRNLKLRSSKTVRTCRTKCCGKFNEL